MFGRRAHGEGPVLASTTYPKTGRAARQTLDALTLGARSGIDSHRSRNHIILLRAPVFTFAWIRASRLAPKSLSDDVRAMRRCDAC
jgi:hypothetical protein